MSKKITDKIKEVLTPSDQKVLEEAIEKLIETRVALREEELKTKYDELAEEYCRKEIEERLEKEKATLIELYDEKLNNLEKKIVSKLDSFLEHVITEQISDETLNKIAVNEVALPLIVNIKRLFTEHYIDLDSQGSAIIKQKDERIKELEERVTELSKKVLESEERLEKSASFLLISEKTEGLTQTQKQRVIRMFKNKPFSEIKENIDEFVEMIKESSLKNESVKRNTRTIDSVLTEESNTFDTEKKVVREDERQFLATSIVEVASRYI